MTDPKIEALVEAGEKLAEEAVSGISCDCDCDCVLCDRLRALVSSWRTALADLRADLRTEEQPAPVPGDVRAVLARIAEEDGR